MSTLARSDLMFLDPRGVVDCTRQFASGGASRRASSLLATGTHPLHSGIVNPEVRPDPEVAWARRARSRVGPACPGGVRAREPDRRRLPRTSRAAAQGPRRELTGRVNLTRDKDEKTRARLLDLVFGRSGQGVPAVAAGTRRGIHRGGEDRHGRSVPGGTRTRSAAGWSRRPSETAAARVTRCLGSGWP